VKREKGKIEMASDEDIQKVWQRIRRLDLVVMKDRTYQLAVTSPSNTNTKVPNIGLFVSRRMTKEMTYNHLTKVYEKMKSCPISGRSKIVLIVLFRNSYSQSKQIYARKCILVSLHIWLVVHF
jgi:hypothetical protein